MESSLQFSAHLFSASELSLRSLPSLSSIAVVLFCCVLANHFQSSVCFVAISLCYSLIYFSALLVYLSFDSFTLLLTWFYGTAPRLLGCCIFPFFFFFFFFFGGGGGGSSLLSQSSRVSVVTKGCFFFLCLPRVSVAVTLIASG